MHEHRPQNLRNAAARAFRESLEQLEDILASEPQTADSDVKIWEEAAADLDAFFDEEESPQAGMLDEESEEYS